MPQNLDRVGTFRGRVVDHAVSETKKSGLPQLVAKIEATEYFDEKPEEPENPGEWVDWSEYEMQTTAYLVLFGADGRPCLNLEQCQKAFGWDGESFASLNDMDLAGVRFQFRVEDETYDGQTRRKVVWIDDSDATPGQTIKKLDAKGLKALDGRYAGQLGGKAKAPAGKPPTAAPKSPAKAAAPTPAPAPEPESDTTVEPEAAPPKAPPKAKKAKAKTAASTPMTKDLAWESVMELKTEAVENDALAEAWTTSCDEVMGEDWDWNENPATAKQWTAIRDATLDKIPHIPF